MTIKSIPIRMGLATQPTLVFTLVTRRLVFRLASDNFPEFK